MQIIEVTDKKTIKDFLNVPRILYKNDKNFICPLDIDIERIFDPKRNPYFTHGVCTRWILKDDQNNLIGRVAAFINEKKAHVFEQPTGGMGFFDCIDNKDAAFILFDTCKKWLVDRGMKAMDGPINFSENDSFWGLLVEGFTEPPYGMNYNHPYYRKFFEEYGFVPYYEQITNFLDLTKPFPERFWKIADWLMSKPGFTFEHFKRENAEKYLQDIKKVYDEAWANHEGFTPLKIEDVRSGFEKAKPILIDDFVWFAYHEGEPIGFCVMLPDVNQIFKHFNGKLNLINKLRFLYYKHKKVMNRAKITVMGVSPRFQRYGIESGIFRHQEKPFLKRKNFKTIELSWVGDFNPKMNALHAATGSIPIRKHITYRMFFEEGQNRTKMKVIR